MPQTVTLAMKPKLQTALFILVVLAALGWWGYDTLSKRRIEKAHEQRRTDQQIQMTEKVAALSQRFNAINGWEEKISKTGRDAFSIEIEDALVNTGGKAILINGYLDDVSRRADKYYLHVSGEDTGSQEIDFVLECDSELAKRVSNQNTGFSEYAFIAQIVSVEKAEFQLKSGVKTTEDDVPIEVDSSSLFLAHGRCLDLVKKD
jgi:hypothetical protein